MPLYLRFMNGLILIRIFRTKRAIFSKACDKANDNAMSRLNYQEGLIRTIGIKRINIVDQDGKASKKSVASSFQLREEDPTSDTFYFFHVSFRYTGVSHFPRSRSRLNKVGQTFERICIAVI